MIRTIVTLAIIMTQFGFMKPEHSRLEVQSHGSKSSLDLMFIIVPNSGIKVTTEGPWQLTLTKIEGLDLPAKEGKTVYKMSQFNPKIPGFSIHTQARHDRISFDYRLKSFVCTEDKSRCYPEIHQGHYETKVPNDKK